MITVLGTQSYQSNRLLEPFGAGVPANTAADLVGLNRRTAIHLYHRLRLIMAWQIQEALTFPGVIEVDESYFSGRCKGKREGAWSRGHCASLGHMGVLFESSAWSELKRRGVSG